MSGEMEPGEAYYRAWGWSGCAGSAWSTLPQATKDGWAHAEKLGRERDAAQEHVADHLRDFRPGADMTATGDLAVDMCSFADRMKMQRDQARTELAALREKVAGLAGKWKSERAGYPLNSDLGARYAETTLRLCEHELRALLAEGGAQ